MAGKNIHDLFYEADDAVKSGEVVKARKLLESLLQEDPKFGRAYNHLGWIYDYKYDNFPLAEKHYLKALEFAPDYPATYKNYAALLSVLNRYTEFHKFLKKARLIPGVNLKSLNAEEAIVQEKQGKLKKALDCYRDALMMSFDTKEINRFKEDIKRVKDKVKFFKSK